MRLLRSLRRANTSLVTTPAPVIEGATAAQDAQRAWQAVHADPSIQFAPLPAPPPPAEPPALVKVLEALLEPIGRALGLSWPVLQWVLLALGVALALYIIYRIVSAYLPGRNLTADAVADEPVWVPQQAEALALLEDADRLAGEGRFDEATHLLLVRSVQHIAAVRPDWVPRASTAREIAALPHLPAGARSAFALIAARVERSLFALRGLGADDWQAARAAYASFALERIAP